MAKQEKVYQLINEIVNMKDFRQGGGQSDAVKKEKEYLDALDKEADEKKEKIEAAKKANAERAKVQTEDAEGPGGMLKNSLCQAHEAATNLMKEIQDYSNLPDWIQAKIILASDYLVKVEAHFNATKKQDEPKQPNPEEEQEKPPVGEPPMAARVSPVPSPALNPKTAIGFALNREGPKEEEHYA
jgi:hypothetical protein